MLRRKCSGELAASGALASVRAMFMENHHKVRLEDRFSEVVQLLENNSLAFDVAAVLPIFTRKSSGRAASGLSR